MSLIRIQEPAVEPISLDEAKVHLRVDPDMAEDDALIRGLIATARRNCETQTGRSLVTQRWRLLFDAFPAAVVFERGPIQSVDTLNWLDMGGVAHTITNPGGPDYALSLGGPMPRMTPGFGRIWPIPLPQIGSVWIDYTAGYGPQASAVPESLRSWMLLRLATLYNNREEVATGISVTPMPYVDSLLDDERVWLA